MLGRDRDAAHPDVARLQQLIVPHEYRALHEYLDKRFANRVVLTFAEVEDLLGFGLPDEARADEAWWANTKRDGAPSAHIHSWTRARRTATANLRAQIVVFERG
jgi:hypothetical protein